MSRNLFRDAFQKYETVTLDYQIPIWKEGTNKDGILKRITLRDFFASDLIQSVLDPPNWAVAPLTVTGSHTHNIAGYTITLQNGTYTLSNNVDFRVLGQQFLPNATNDNTLTQILGIDTVSGEIKWSNLSNITGNFFDKVLDNSDDITQGATNLFLTPAERAKIGYLTITQAVDLDQIEIDVALNNAKVSNITTNLSTTYAATTVTVTSSDGTDATINEANGATAGMLSAAKYNEIVANTAKVSNATHTGDVAGATTLTAQATMISGKSLNAGLAGTEEVLINNAGTLEKTTVADIAALFSFTLTNGNGTTASGTAVDLGGTLSSNAIINGNSNELELGTAGSNLSYFKVNSTQGQEIYSVPTQGLTIDKNPGGISALMETPSTGEYSNFEFHAGNLQLKANGSSGAIYSDLLMTYNTFELRQFAAGYTSATGIILSSSAGYYFTDGRPTPVGFEYAADYSAGFTARSLVDKDYVDGQISSISLTNGQIFVGDVSNIAQSVAMSGDVAIDNTGLTTIQPDSVTYDKMQDISQAALLGNDNPAGGTVNEIPIIDQYLSAGVVTALLENTSNWDINGNYIGTAISGTFQGQSHYDGNYWFTAVADNVWIRLIRG